MMILAHNRAMTIVPNDFFLRSYIDFNIMIQLGSRLRPIGERNCFAPKLLSPRSVQIYHTHISQEHCVRAEACRNKTEWHYPFVKRQANAPDFDAVDSEITKGDHGNTFIHDGFEN